MDIYLASGNEHKRQEFARLFPEWNIILPPSFSCVEDGSTFIENAMIKAKTLSASLPEGTLVLADDSGLCVDALGGAPGIHTARYGMKSDGKELPSAERNSLLLKTLSGVPNRKASFVCALVLIAGANRIFCVQETASGAIAESPSGHGGFGYDPIFLVDEAGGRHMADLSDSEKDQYSHRGRACRIMKRILEEIDGNKKSE